VEVRRILKEHKVIVILDEPKRVALKLDHLDIEYWSVTVIMKGSKKEYESSVTFETFDKAIALKEGDTFLR